MKTHASIFVCTAMLGICLQARDIANPAIQYDRFSDLTRTLAPVREKHRVTEDEFLRMSAEPGTVILDARSRDRYERIHVKGAVHLAFTDFTAEALQKAIPDKSARILIYCNNNFENEPVNFPAKTASVALNIQTFVNLHAYGYTNVYELGPLLDIGKTRIPFTGSDVGKDGSPLMMDKTRIPVSPPPANTVLPKR